MADHNPDSFVKAMLPFLADPDLSDADKIGLLGLGSWAWDKDHCWPTNAQLAQRCGWLAKGKPSILKAKRTLRRLEAKGRIRRVVVVTNGVPSRPRIELIPPTTNPGSNLTLDGSIMTLPRINNDPTSGQNGPAPRVNRDLPSGQNGTVPGSGMTHYIDPATDSNHRPIAGDEPAAPPTAAGVGVDLAALAEVPAGDYLGSLMAILRCVAERGATITLEDLEVVADQIDRMLGFTPGPKQQSMSDRDRWRLYLNTGEAVANGYDLHAIEAGIRSGLENHARHQQRPGEVGREVFYWAMWNTLHRIRQWGINSAGYHRKSFRAILPDMRYYRAKGG